MRNNRIGVNGFLNQPCALIPDLESIMRARMRKIVLQQICQFRTHALQQSDKIQSRTSSAVASSVAGTARRAISFLRLIGQFDFRRLLNRQIAGLAPCFNGAGRIRLTGQDHLAAGGDYAIIEGRRFRTQVRLRANERPFCPLADLESCAP